MIKAVIFDVDNTLIDFILMKDMSIRAAAAAMIDAGLEEKKEDIVSALWKLLGEHGYEDPQVFQRYLKATAGAIDYRILANAVNAYRRVRTGFLEPFPHVIGTLTELVKKGVKLAVVTDAPRLKAWIRLTAMRIDHLFDFVVAFEDTQEHKPSRKPFEIALKKLNLEPAECLMIGDSPARDVQGAKLLGIKTCFARYGNPAYTGKTEADFEIKDIKEILQLIS
ncbi:HAD-IIIA family hydrolase [Candidatus Woesearchaeota archaeon]|nr:HAD-IIIA family hydrolase [Candidatus Woesearchaeota archaeon]